MRFDLSDEEWAVIEPLSFLKTQNLEATTIPMGQIWAVSSDFHGGGACAF